MSTEEQITAMIAGLEPWRRKYGGSVDIAHDVPHLFKVLGESPGKVRAGILFAGETIRDELNSDVVGRVDRKFWIAFSRGYSLESYKGKSLVSGIAGGGPLFQIIDAAKTPLRKLRIGTDDEPVPFYKGTELLTFEGVTLDAYRIEITVTAELEDLTDDFEPAEEAENT